MTRASIRPSAVQEVIPTIDGPVVLAGDLNAPISSSSSSTRIHARSVDEMRAHGLVSAFTEARGDVDPLSEPTYYHWRKADQPFHIDHVFVPKEWSEGINVQIGTYHDWVATKRSDHVPIIVDVNPPEVP